MFLSKCFAVIVFPVLNFFLREIRYDKMMMMMTITMMINDDGEISPTPFE